MGVRETVLERTTGPYLAAVLKLMAFTFNRDEGLKSQLYRRRNGTTEPFDTRYQFRTDRRLPSISILPSRTGGCAPAPALSATLISLPLSATASPCARSFRPFSHADPLNLMIENKLSFEGNMSYLSRLGLLTAMARNRKLAKSPERGGGRRRQDAARRLHAGDVAVGEASRDAALREDAGDRRPRRPLPQPLHPRRLPATQGDAR